MPFKGNRIFIIIIIVFLVVMGTVAVAYSATHKAAPTPTPTPDPNTPIVTPPPAVISVTVKSAVGVNTISVTDQNTGSTIILTAADLPATYTFKNGDTLVFKVNSATGYRFNAWVFGDASYDSHNPYTIKVTASFIMEAHFLTDGVT